MARTNMIPGRVRRRAFSPFATAVLATAFSINTTPTKEQRECLAAAIGTTERRVQVWFQNRRQRTGATVSTAARSKGTAGTDATQPADLDGAFEHTACSEDASSRAATAAAGGLPAARLPSTGAPPSPPLVGMGVDAAGAAALAAHGCALPPPAPTLRPGEAEAGRIFPGANSMEVYTSAFAPYEIMWASPGWLRFCGYEDAEVRGCGHTLKILHGPATDGATLAALMDAVARSDSIRVSLVNYTRSGVAFAHDVDVQPLRNSQGVAVIYKVASSSVHTLAADPAAAAAALGAAGHAGDVAGDEPDDDDDDDYDDDEDDEDDVGEEAADDDEAAAAAPNAAPSLADKGGAVFDDGDAADGPASEGEEASALMPRVPSLVQIVAC